MPSTMANCITHLRVGHGLTQLICTQAEVVDTTVVLDEIHRTFDVSRCESVLLLFKSLVDDTAGEIVHSLPFNHVVQHHLTAVGKSKLPEHWFDLAI